MSHQNVPHNYSRSSQSTPSPSTTTANLTNESAENIHFNPIVKMEVPDDDSDENEQNNGMDQKSCENGNFNYVGEYIAAELNKLPLRDAFVLKNILIREVLSFSEKLVMSMSAERWNYAGISHKHLRFIIFRISDESFYWDSQFENFPATMKFSIYLLPSPSNFHLTLVNAVSNKLFKLKLFLDLSCVSFNIPFYESSHSKSIIFAMHLIFNVESTLKWNQKRATGT